MRNFLKLFTILILISAVNSNIINYNAGNEAKQRAEKILVYRSANYGWVDGYYRSDGTYVRGHYKDKSNNGYCWDNLGGCSGYGW